MMERNGDTVTRKDYELIARTISDLHLGDEERDYVMHKFAVALFRDNERFDVQRFRAACQKNTHPNQGSFFGKGKNR